MRNILVANFQGEADVMIFTQVLTVEEVTMRLNAKGKSYDDICEVKDEELEFYVYESCYPD